MNINVIFCCCRVCLGLSTKNSIFYAKNESRSFFEVWMNCWTLTLCCRFSFFLLHLFFSFAKLCNFLCRNWNWLWHCVSSIICFPFSGFAFLMSISITIGMSVFSFGFAVFSFGFTILGFILVTLSFGFTIFSFTLRTFSYSIIAVLDMSVRFFLGFCWTVGNLALFNLWSFLNYGPTKKTNL